MSELPRQLSARVDKELARNLTDLAPTGLSYSEIVKQSVALFATVYRVAVENNVAEPHEIPELTAYRYKLPPKWTPPPPRTGALTLPPKRSTPREEVPAVRPPARRPAGARDSALPGLGLAGHPRARGVLGQAGPRPEPADAPMR
ncbi:hypothetical protein SEA_ALVY_72 [Streptomyces phage Alvy]|uniref:Uncharacterized protein n=1 Tax=Streptomyces phage Alvy TaxID=2599888 RepID=A0A5J6TNU8_9CAUD|nr:hypothetical protein KGG89_gp22 [Streptomyces phage Alvy]QFG12500.1 hypothetical protein SEA_ALVY_72 [Streptomyces phage Alvy]